MDYASDAEIREEYDCKSEKLATSQSRMLSIYHGHSDFAWITRPMLRFAKNTTAKALKS